MLNDVCYKIYSKAKNIVSEVRYEHELVRYDKLERDGFITSLDIYDKKLNDLIDLVDKLFECDIIPEKRYNQLINDLLDFRYQFDVIYDYFYKFTIKEN